MKFKLVEAAESKICCICKKPFDGYGNNAEPVCSGSCCDECNMKEVIPARLKMMKNGKTINESVNPLTLFKNLPAAGRELLLDVREYWDKIFADATEGFIDPDIGFIFKTRDNKFKYLMFENGDRVGSDAFTVYNSLIECILHGEVTEDYDESKERLIQTIPGASEIIAAEEADPMNAEYFEESLDESKELSEELSMHELVKDSINHLVNDLGKDPTAEDFADSVVLDIENNYEIEVPADIQKYSRWASAIMCEVSRQLNAIEEDYGIDESEKSNEAELSNSEKLFRKFPELRKSVNEEVDEIITENLPDETYKITYYLSTATRDRRPETREDIDNDYRVDTIHAAGDFEAMKEAFRIQRELDDSDIDFEMADYDIESVDDFIKYFNNTDWSDGSILMLKVEGPDGVIYDTGYTKDSFIKELDDTLEHQKKMIAEMEKIDPKLAAEWRTILNVQDATSVEQPLKEAVEGKFRFVDNIDIELPDRVVIVDNGANDLERKGLSGQYIWVGYKHKGWRSEAAMNDVVAEVAYAIAEQWKNESGMQPVVENKLSSTDMYRVYLVDEFDEELDASQTFDDVYSFDEIDEMLTEDAEIKRFRHMYGVE